jgi:hypothetical protein
MGSFTHFAGRLEFTRRLDRRELSVLESVLKAGWYDAEDPKTEAAVERMIRADRVNRQCSKGPLIYDGASMADFRAQLRGFMVGEGITARNAGDLKITNDARGLEYCSEKSYRMVESLNFIIINAGNRIAGFGLKGQLLALTEAAPNEWFIRIGADGSAYQASAKPEDMPAFKRAFAGIYYDEATRASVRFRLAELGTWLAYKFH